MDEYRKVVVLDRVLPRGKPDYCLHGKATCVRCGHWCWLGSESSKVVMARTVDPLCLECAKVILPDAVPAGNVNDHLIADGPHD